jgi:hypothetical protein
MAHERRQEFYAIAEREFRRILKADRYCFTALTGLGQIYATRDANYFDAVRLYDRALVTKLGDPEALLLKSAALRRFG